MEKKRLVWVDALKGVLILLVVLGHAIQATLQDACEINHLWNAIYSFHMSAFMAVSGYLTYRSTALIGGGSYVITLIVRRFRQLMIPFLLWTLLSLLINFKFSIRAITDCLLYPDRGLWFLWVLFFINVFFVIGIWISERIHVKQELTILFICVLLVVIMLMFEPRLFGFQFIAYYFLFYTIGFYLHKYADKIIRSNWFYVAPLAFCWCILAWFWQMHELPVWLKSLPFPEALLQYGYRFITATVAIYVLLAVSPGILNGQSLFNKPFMELGKISLGIYACHMIITGRLARLFYNWGLNETMIIICTFLAALFTSWMVVWLLSKWKYSAKYLLGKI